MVLPVCQRVEDKKDSPGLYSFLQGPGLVLSFLALALNLFPIYTDRLKTINVKNKSLSHYSKHLFLGDVEVHIVIHLAVKVNKSDHLYL